MPNLAYNNNGLYFIPNADGTPSTELYKVPPCNYAPTEPCSLKKGLWSEVAIETKAYENCIWNWNRAMCLLNSLVAANRLQALDTNIVLSAEFTDEMKDSIEKTFISTL